MKTKLFENISKVTNLSSNKLEKTNENNSKKRNVANLYNDYALDIKKNKVDYLKLAEFINEQYEFLKNDKSIKKRNDYIADKLDVSRVYVFRIKRIYTENKDLLNLMNSHELKQAVALKIIDFDDELQELFIKVIKKDSELLTTTILEQLSTFDKSDIEMFKNNLKSSLDNDDLGEIKSCISSVSDDFVDVEQFYKLLQVLNNKNKRYVDCRFNKLTNTNKKTLIKISNELLNIHKNIK